VVLAHQPQPLMATTATTCLHRARSVQQPHPSVLVLVLVAAAAAAVAAEVVHVLRRAMSPTCRAGCVAVGQHQVGGHAKTRPLLGASSALGTRARPPAASRPRALPQRPVRCTSCRPAPRYRNARPVHHTRWKLLRQFGTTPQLQILILDQITKAEYK
jgi:hypothetical protein